jgi:hypothetical protein
MTRHSVRITVFLVGLTFVGCAKSPAPPRPIAGDTVTVELITLKSWQVGQPIILSAKLRVQGPKELEPAWLTNEEVPHDAPPRATLTFWHGDEILQTFDDVPMTPAC